MMLTILALIGFVLSISIISLFLLWLFVDDWVEVLIIFSSLAILTFVFYILVISTKYLFG